jgi:hypothetical protein
MLLDRRLGQPLTELLNVRGHVQELDIEDLRELLSLPPAGKLQNRREIGPPGVGIVDIGGEILDKALGRLRRRRVELRDGCPRGGGGGGGRRCERLIYARKRSTKALGVRMGN